MWGYDTHLHDLAPATCHRPISWMTDFPNAGGSKQSPIDINTKITRYTSLPDLRIKYDPSRCKSITNNGHTFNVNVDEYGTNLRGGPLRHNYRLAQFHCHWGSSDKKGSEHTINGHHYAAELHLVHWNTNVCKTFKEAVVANEGIVVLGVFIKVGKENTVWSDLQPLLEKVRYKGDSCELENTGFDSARLLPENKRDYWTYEGSLTTPPCYESVRFILFKEPVEVSHAQLDDCCRSLSYKSKSDGETSYCKMVNNFRPCMPLNGRVVTSTFQTTSTQKKNTESFDSLRQFWNESSINH